ncbi:MULTISPECIES: hypothetical protein [unclassified Polaromonas]|uniref:hypothetical protein n=1 Tax=unclassified Polaromonas TaxID=2638319 RepID=UPI0025D522E4|nr:MULTISPECIES: hypothetical protein [unclassified Polaromonas]HQR99810.1 hypothetical protein [Polaromonas sp.]HQS42567.1 hypothetical protein [Polaromonas sp.]HQS89002.1 hypothetical protein [Polaromonas sp.]HQT08585.1 hypothetical protein [Polaromonas sp.]
MKLKSIEYSERNGEAQEWSLERLLLGQKTLLVGKNASGKSRTLNVINGLARHLSGLQPPSVSGTYNCEFEHEEKIYTYHCVCASGEVMAEALVIDGKVSLERGPGGVGKIWAEKIDKGSYIDFQTPPSEFAAVTRRDSIQHSFLEPLYQWAAALRHFQFGSNLGKDLFAVFAANGAEINERDQKAVVGLFRNGKRDFGDRFTSALIQDMKEVGYYLDSIDIGAPVSVVLPPTPNGEIHGLLLKEKDLEGFTDQIGMSQGMYRVLSLLINVDYFQLKGKGSCILVDDIGEGLDFERSCRLISLLRKKAEEFKLQIVISTNDRFVMNEVPLEEWAVAQRKGNRVSFKNIENSRQIFENFKFTGLSNFSFLELDVINEPIGEGA